MYVAIGITGDDIWYCPGIVLSAGRCHCICTFYNHVFVSLQVQCTQMIRIIDSVNPSYSTIEANHAYCVQCNRCTMLILYIYPQCIPVNLDSGTVCTVVEESIHTHNNEGVDAL